jgi:hypothetical protein
MAEHPAWDYWMYETIQDQRVISIYEGKDLDKGDIRNKKYLLDQKTWCRQYFWDAEQAAVISFGRDPDKVVSRDEFVPWDEEDEDFKEHIKLWDQMEKRYLLIKEAQEKGILQEIFPPAMYIEWGKHKGFYIPDFVVGELEVVRHERSGRIKPHKFFTGLYVDSDEGSENDSEQVSEKNHIKIMLALLIESDLIKKGTGALSKKLAETLKTKAHDHGDDDLKLGDESIKERLDAAHDLLK